MASYYNPVQIITGNASLKQLPALLAKRNCLLITFPQAKNLGLVQRVRDLIGAQLCGVIDAVQPNPDVQWLAALYDQVQRDYSAVPCIVALGGGSVIDCAKALLCATPSGRFDELLAALKQDTKLAPGPHKALIAIPTTAGTGSEVTPWATIWDHLGGRKYSLHQSCTWAQAAIVDAELTLGLCADTTLATGLDALSHAFESIWNINRNPVSTALAVQSARCTMATLPLLLQDLGNLPLRCDMANAALLAGLAFSNTKTALAHALSYDITLHHGVAHGIACSFSLPLVLEMALGVDAAVDAALLRILDADTPAGAVQVLRTWLHQLGVPTDPAHYGVAPNDWMSMVYQASSGARGRNFIRQFAA